MKELCMRVVLLYACAGALCAQDNALPKTASEATDYTELVFKYGPFAFAVLFGLVALWLIRGAKEAASSVEPVVRPLAKQYWTAAIVAGITCIVFAAIGTHHWLKIAESTHIFRGEIMDLADYEQVDADDFYLRTQPKKVLLDGVVLRNEHFAVIRDRPFVRGDVFEITYFKVGAAKRAILKFEYLTEAYPTYRIEYDEKAGAIELVKVPLQAVARATKVMTSPFAAQAQTIPVLGATLLMSPQQAQRAVLAQSVVALRLVGLLQDARTPVGAKIDLLDRLRAMDAATLKAYAETVVNRELFALSLIELTGHSDKELASKARMVVEKSDAELVLARELSSPKADVRTAAEQALFRVSQDRAERILKQAPASPRTQALSTQVRSGAKQQILTPVGSATGDRYYVQANWDPNNEKTMKCLSELFNKELTSNRSPAEEEKLMKGRSERIAYWYTKEWVLAMAEKIRGCGGKASFPKPIPKG